MAGFGKFLKWVKKYVAIKLVVVLVILAATVHSVNYRFNGIKIERLKLDTITQTMKPIIPDLKDQTIISLVHDPDDIMVSLQAQFVLAPTILERNTLGNDTVLVIRNIANDRVQFSPVGYDTIRRTSDRNYDIVLYSKAH